MSLPAALQKFITVEQDFVKENRARVLVNALPLKAMSSATLLFPV